MRINLKLSASSCKLLVALLLATPLAAQQTVVVPDVSVVVEPAAITNEITVIVSDSLVAAVIDRLQASLDSAVAVLTDCDRCESGGTSTVVRVGQGALVFAAFLIAYQLKRLVDKETGDTVVEEYDDPETGEGN